MKQFLGSFLLFIFIFVVTVVSAPAYATGKEVIVYNWSEYIPQSVLDDFTKETGIKVNYSTYESNEAMFAKIRLLRGKSYDVVVPSSYFVEKMKASDLLTPLDHARLENFKNLDSNMTNLEFDRGNAYSIPYMWGYAGLGYNTKYIKKGSVSAWADLLKPEFAKRVILTDDLRDAFGIGLRVKGYDVNSKDPQEIAEAYAFLKELKPSVRVFDITAIKQALISEEVWIGPIWNGDFIISHEENKNLEFVFPKEGAFNWMDNFVILKNAPNPDNAYAFINYMLRPDVALRCVEEFKYSTPNKGTLDIMDPELRNNFILVPTQEHIDQMHFINDIGKTLQEYEKYWGDLKALK